MKKRAYKCLSQNTREVPDYLRWSQTTQILQMTQTTCINNLKCNLECMVINILIYIVCMKDVRRDTVMAILDRYEVCTTKDGMNMNHLHFSLPICIKIQLCHDRMTPSDSARPLVCCRLKSNHDRTPPTLCIHLRSDNGHSISF